MDGYGLKEAGVAIQRVMGNHVRLCIDYEKGQGFTAGLSVEGISIEAEGDTIGEAVGVATMLFTKAMDVSCH